MKHKAAIIKKLRETPEEFHITGVLNRDNKCFCAMGIVAEACGLQARQTGNYYVYDFCASTLSKKLLALIDVTQVEQALITRFNDEVRLTFKEMADFIENGFRHSFSFDLKPETYSTLQYKLWPMIDGLICELSINNLVFKGSGHCTPFRVLKIGGVDVDLTQFFGENLHIEVKYETRTNLACASK